MQTTTDTTEAETIVSASVNTLARVVTVLEEAKQTMLDYVKGTNGSGVNVDAVGNISTIVTVSERRDIANEIAGIEIAIDIVDELATALGVNSDVALAS